MAYFQPPEIKIIAYYELEMTEQEVAMFFYLGLRKKFTQNYGSIRVRLPHILVCMVKPEWHICRFFNKNSS
jgi:hypothetical protein